jgi:three-Cys-motif partner protein
LPCRCVGDWTEDKHFYLRRYCDIFTSGMKKKWPKLLYVDLFAGPGRCRVRPAGTILDGSPLIALAAGFTHLAFVELSEECADALERRLRPATAACRVIRGDANAAVSDVLDYVASLGSNCLGFAFVDPPGIEIKFQTLQTLCRATRLDLLINFPLGMNIKRQFWQRWEAAADEEDGFDQFFGTPTWRECIKDNPGGPERKWELLFDLYVRQLRSIGYQFVGDTRSIKHGNRLLYHLIFASRDPRGEDFWNKIATITPTGQRRLF